MEEPYIGEIRIFGFNYPPRGWALCDGQALPIAQYSILYGLLGTAYGGNGKTDFCVPDLRGRVPVHVAGPTIYERGDFGGLEEVILKPAEMPVHTHAVKATNDPGDKFRGAPTRPFAASNDPSDPTYHAAEDLVPMHPGVIGAEKGGGQPHDNIQPTLVVNYAIALEGNYPPHLRRQ